MISDIRYRLRKRTIVEIFDFAFLTLRANFKMILKFALPPLLIIIATNIFAISRFRLLDDPMDGYALLTLLLMIEVPLLELSLLFVNGKLMFEEKPSIRATFIDLLKVLPTYIFHVGFIKSILTLTFPLVITIWNSAIRGYFAGEVIVLERTRGFAIWKRLSRFPSGAILGFRVLELLLGFLWLSLGFYFYYIVFGMLDYKNPPWYLKPEFTLFSPWVHILYLTFILYRSVARFLYYIDMRSDAEGWAIEVNLKRSMESMEKTYG